MKNFIFTLLFSGFIMFEVYPPHNEPITPFMTIARYRIESRIDYNLFGFTLAWNPIVWADGRWPEMTNTYNPDRWFLENHFRVEKSVKNWTFFFNKINYYAITDNTYNLPIWWSYGNGVGVRYDF